MARSCLLSQRARQGGVTRAYWRKLHSQLHLTLHLPALQAALARQQPVEYNKPNPLNPYFVVYGRRRQ